MLARTGSGAWRPLEALQQLPTGGFSALCEGNLGSVLDYGLPLLVGGTMPDLPGRPDALCIDGQGHLAIVVAFHDRSQEDGLAALLESAASLTGADVATIVAACSRIEEAGSLERWWRLVDANVEVSATQVQAALESTLGVGPDLVAVVPPTAGSGLLAPLRYLAQLTGGRLRCFELEAWVAGDVETVHTSELALAGNDHVARTHVAVAAKVRTELKVQAPAAAAGPPVVAPRKAIEQSAEPASALEVAAADDAGPSGESDEPTAQALEEPEVDVAEAPEAVAEAEVTPLPGRASPRRPRLVESDRAGAEGDRFAVRLLERAEDELGHRHLEVLRELTEFATHHFDELSIQGSDDYPLLRCDLGHGDDRTPMLLMSPDGAIVFDLKAVPSSGRERAMSRVSQALELTEKPRGTKVVVSIAEHLNDQAHVEAFRERVMDAIEAAGAGASQSPVVA